jgi:hypothetical protein
MPQSHHHFQSDSRENDCNFPVIPVCTAVLKVTWWTATPAASWRSSVTTASSASRTGLSGEKSATSVDAPSRRSSAGISAGPPDSET